VNTEIQNFVADTSETIYDQAMKLLEIAGHRFAEASVARQSGLLADEDDDASSDSAEELFAEARQQFDGGLCETYEAGRLLASSKQSQVCLAEELASRDIDPSLYTFFERLIILALNARTVEEVGPAGWLARRLEKVVDVNGRSLTREALDDYLDSLTDPAYLAFVRGVIPFEKIEQRQRRLH